MFSRGRLVASVDDLLGPLKGQQDKASLARAAGEEVPGARLT